MNQPQPKLSFPRWCSPRAAALMAAALAALSPSAPAADSINVLNPSFEDGALPPSYIEYFVAPPGLPGYSAIPSWNQGNTNLSGVNISSASFGGPFWDNGNLPDGKLTDFGVPIAGRVAFIQGSGIPDGLLYQTQTGFVVGQNYWIQAFVNARSNGGAADSCDLFIAHSASPSGTSPILGPQNIPPVGGGNPFVFVNLPFTASATSGELYFLNQAHAGGDSALLLDGVCVIARSADDVVIANPSFEASGTGQYPPGVGTVATVAGWTIMNGAPFAIINQVGGPYLDHSQVVPDGNNVLVIQDTNGISQVLHGLTVGHNYRLTLYANCRGDSTTPSALVMIDGNTAFNGPVPFTGNGAYNFISYDFTASAADVTLSIQKQDGGSSLLVDNVRLVHLLPTTPTVVIQPASKLALAGTSVTLSSIITGYPAPTFQWKHEGTNVPNATSQSLTLNPLQPADAGSYVLYVTNAAGWTNTSPAKVTVAVNGPDSAYVANPSFEANYNPLGAHYSDINDWSVAGGGGLNNASGPFWDNGNLPDTAQVAFMQGDGYLHQDGQIGFTVGQTYWIQAFANQRYEGGSYTALSLSVAHSASSLGYAKLLDSQTISPVGSGNPFVLVNVPFTAAATSGDLYFEKAGGGSASLLLDGISVIKRSTKDIVIANPSFEASGFGQAWPGAVGEIAGWTKFGTDMNRLINQVGGPYLDHGEVVPDGNNVLVLQSAGGCSQVLHGLTVGETYRLTLYVNARSNPTPQATALVMIDGKTAFDAPVPQLGSSPYQLISCDFTASAADVTLSIENQTDTSALFVDNVRVVDLGHTGPLTITRIGSDLQITWPSGHLESTTNLVTGPWVPVSGAVSPQLITPSGPAMFYRSVTP